MKSKKLIALLLAGAMALSTLPMAAMADGDDNEEPTVSIYYKINGEEEPVESTAKKLELDPAGEVPVSNVYAEGKETVVTVNRSVESDDADNFWYALEAQNGAQIKVVGDVKTDDTDFNSVICASGAGSSVTVEGNVVASEDDGKGIYAGDNAKVTVNKNVSGGEMGVGGENSEVDILGSIEDTDSGIFAFYADIDVKENVESNYTGIQAMDSNIHVGGNLSVGLPEMPENTDEFKAEDYSAIDARNSTVIIDGNVNSVNAPVGGVDTVLVKGNSDVKIGGDLFTDKARTIKVGDTYEGDALVEVVGKANGNIEALAEGNTTIIIGGELNGKLVLAGDLPLTEEEKKAHEDEGQECAQSNEQRVISTFKGLPEGATFVIWKAVDDEGNIAKEEDLFELDLDTYGEYINSKVVEVYDPNIGYGEGGSLDSDLEAETTESLENKLLNAYRERTFYIIKEADPENVSMDITGDEGILRTFEGVKGADGKANEYKAIREGQCFTVSVNVPEGYKLTGFSAYDGIKIDPNADGTFTVWADFGGGINLDATLEKIMKSFKVEKATSSSSAPSFRVTDQKASLSADKAKLTAKVKCSNMDYARKLLANVRFYLDEELSENKYYTVYLNDNGELEVELSPELIAMIEAGYHLVEMVLVDNGINIPFEVDLIKD